jgi:predicted nuclease of predicted toxin-antitoxin system
MQLLANENFPLDVVEAVRKIGHDVAWIRTDAPGSKDRDILQRAVSEQRVLLTFDKDFGELAFQFGLPATCGMDAWLARCMTDPHSIVRGELLAEFRKSRNAPRWPTIRRDRTIAELTAAAEGIEQEADRQAAAKAARQRTKRLAGMAADPARTLRETEKLVAQRSGEVYREIATRLAELREALAGSEQSGVADEQARKLKNQNPTLRLLTSELRRAGFVPK